MRCWSRAGAGDTVCDAGGLMATCEVCGNDYYLSFEVVTAGVSHTFDSFECAIQALAPICAHCGCKIIGHGIEANGTFYCCGHCAHTKGARSIVDNAAHATID
jgi:hypothetical protein